MTGFQSSVPIEDFEKLCAGLPEGLTAELVDGMVTVVAIPDGGHDADVAFVAAQLESDLSGHRLFQNRGLAVGTDGTGRVRPDGVFAPLAAFVGQPPWSDPGEALLVLEVTSGHQADAEVDRVEKRDAYAHSGIPVYLLIDRHRREAVVHWEPAGGRYTHESSTVFGGRLALPQPFGSELDTARLV